jgi:hypothetical protein
VRPRLAIIAGAASDFRASVRRARAQRRPRVARTVEPAVEPAFEESADEVKRRLDETHARLRSQIPPRAD